MSDVGCWMVALSEAISRSDPHGVVVSSPEGVRLVYLPPYTPELQPAETLWPLVDEPVVNRHIANLEELERLVEQRCATLSEQTNVIRSRTSFHWLIKPAKPKHKLN